MLWEIGEDIRQYFKMTFLPAMRNLFSSWRSLLGMLLVMLVLQMLLSVICIFGVENIKNSQAVLENFQDAISKSSSTVTEASGSFLTSNDFKTALSSTTIFIGAIALWAICALTLYAKVTFAAADRDKYIWGMLITNGAKKKKIRAMLKNELYIPHFAAIAIAYPVALWVCNVFLKDLGYSYHHSTLTLIIILVLSYICIRIVVAYEGLLIRSMSCVEMLREEDSPKSVCFPRRHSRLRFGFTPTRYAFSTFIRMRKYYMSLALIAAVPALIWICLQVSAVSSDAYLGEEIKEFTVTIDSGVTESELERISEKLPNRIDGISAVSSSASYDAKRLYSHLLIGRNNLSTTDTSPLVAATYADSSIKLCTAEKGFKYSTGRSLQNPAEGTVRIIYPHDQEKYSFEPDTTLYLAVSRTGDDITVIGETCTFSDSFEYIKLTVVDVTTYYASDLTAGAYSCVEDVYFVLNTNDYQKICQRDVSSLTDISEFGKYTYTSELAPDASFELTVPRTEFTQTLSAGNAVEIRGTVTADITLNADGGTHQKQLNSSSFKYLYINSVQINDSTVSLRVTPHFILKMRSEDNIPDILLGFGTPALESNTYQHFASTTESMTLTNGSVRLYNDSLVMIKNSIITADSIGTYGLFTDKQLTNTDRCTPLQELYANSDFRLVLGNATTGNAYGYDLSSLKSNQAFIVLPRSSCLLINSGYRIYVSRTLENTLEYNENATASTNEYDVLDEYVQKNSFEYIPLTVTEVVYSDEITQPYIYVCTDDFCNIININSPYTRLDISIDPYIESERYAQIRSELSLWSAVEQYNCSISSSGEYLEYLIKKNSNYSSVISILVLLIPLIIPFIWYYPLVSLFDRRKNEFKILETIGKKKASVFRAFATEGVMVTLCAFCAVALLCMPAMLLFKTVCSLAALPIEFEYSYLTAPTLLLAGAFSAVCAAAAFAVCYLTTSKGGIKNKKRKESK